MPAPQEKGQKNPQDVLLDTFSTSLMAMEGYLQGLRSDEPIADGSGEVATQMFGHDMVANKVRLFLGSEEFDEHLKEAGRGFRRPFGIVANTLSPNVKLILYPTTVFPAAEEHVAMAVEEGIDVQTEGPQATIYVLDGFMEEADDTPMTAANFAVFIPRLTRALVDSRFPLEKGETSDEFKHEVEDAFRAVRSFTERYLDEGIPLSPTVSRVVHAREEELADMALYYSLYQAEPITPPGLLIPGRDDVPEVTPKQAVAKGLSYLRIDDRWLPQRPTEATDTQSPKAPWREYTLNRWNRDDELYGRYEFTPPEGEGMAEPASPVRTLRVDYKLERRHFPGKYGFFNALEITTVGAEGVDQHIILGQEIAQAGTVTDAEERIHMDADDEVGMPTGVEVFPAIIAGSFDFKDSQTRELLEALVADEATKREVKRPLQDALMLFDQGRLPSVIHMDDVEGAENAQSN